MAKAIWKFAIGKDRMTATLLVPEYAEELSVQWQTDAGIVVWAMCDTAMSKEPRTYRMIGTGWDVPSYAGHYIGTVQAPGGLVWHVFLEMKGAEK